MAVPYRHKPLLVAAWIVAFIGAQGAFRGRVCAAEADPQRPDAPRAWIVMGLPGDPQRHERYLQTVHTIQKALIQRFQVDPGDISVLYGRQGSSSHAACDTATLTAQIGQVANAVADRRSVWVFFLGHADTREGRTTYHIAGEDLSAKALGRRLRQARGPGRLTLVLTMSCSGDFLPALAGRNRTLVAAVPTGTPRNETECPHVLAEILSQPETADANADGELSIAELGDAIRERVAEWYRTREILCTEYLVVDGDGDGLADPSPDGDDIRSARAVSLSYTSLPAGSKE